MAAHLNACEKQEIPCQDYWLIVFRDRLDCNRASMCGLSVAQCPPMQKAIDTVGRFTILYRIWIQENKKNGKMEKYNHAD